MRGTTTRSSSAPPPWAACRCVGGRGGWHTRPVGEAANSFVNRGLRARSLCLADRRVGPALQAHLHFRCYSPAWNPTSPADQHQPSPPPHSHTHHNLTPLLTATSHATQAGAFKIGDAAGTLDNIVACRLYRPGCVGFVSKSGGMSNEMYNVCARAADGIYEGGWVWGWRSQRVGACQGGCDWGLVVRDRQSY